jgi:hypothetical protein
MSFSSTKLGDEFLCIPKIDVAGINWVVYKDQFLWSIDARGLLEHLQGTDVKPADPISVAIRSSKTPLDEAAKLIEAEWKKEVKEWRQGEAVVKQQIAGTVPDSLFIARERHKKYGTSLAMISRRNPKWFQLTCDIVFRKRNSLRKRTYAAIYRNFAPCERTWLLWAIPPVTTTCMPSS